MGLKPSAYVRGPGEKIINANLASFNRNDSSGVKSDALTLVVNTGDQDGVPKKDAELRWFEGYLGSEVDKGVFIITRITPQLFPPQITIVASAAKFKLDDKTGFRERRSRSFDAMTLGDIFRTVIDAHGFSPRVEPSLDKVSISFIEQTDETDASFLRRLAKKYDAIAKPVDKYYVLARRGNLKTISGQHLPVTTISVPSVNAPGSVGFSNASLDESSRSRFKGVKAKHLDVATGEEKTVERGSKPFKKLVDVFANEAEAIAEVESALRENDRKGKVLRLDIEGDPAIVAEGVLLLDESWPLHLRGKFSIDDVKASAGAERPYRLSVSASVPI